MGAYERLQYDKDKQQVYTYHITNDSILITKEPFQQWAGNHTNGTAISPWLIDYRQRTKDRAIEDSLLQAAKSNTPSFLDGILVPKDAKESEPQEPPGKNR